MARCSNAKPLPCSHCTFHLGSIVAVHMHQSIPRSRLLQEARVRADAAVWNALIATAGRAGQLQRAFQALEDMQV